MKIVASMFSTEHNGTTSTGQILGGTLDSSFQSWRIQNRGTLPVRFSLNSTAAATGDMEIAPGADISFPIPSNVYSVMTTSTSTDGSDYTRVRLSALGG